MSPGLSLKPPVSASWHARMNCSRDFLSTQCILFSIVSDDITHLENKRQKKLKEKKYYTCMALRARFGTKTSIKVHAAQYKLHSFVHIDGVKPMQHYLITGPQKELMHTSVFAGGFSAERERGAHAACTRRPHAAASIQHTYTVPEYAPGTKLLYGPGDKAPFIVQVVSITEDPASGYSIRPLKFAKLIHQNGIRGIKQAGIKPSGRNRIIVEFIDAKSANEFIVHPILSQHQYSATIPTYNVTRMGLVRNVPVEWTLEEFVNSLEYSNDDSKVIKARRLNRKSTEDGKTVWIPTQTVALTFIGQTLPEKIFSFYTSLPVETYQLPSIQCNKCCRFGHVKAACRSKPRCYKCAQPHEGDSCSVLEDKATCLSCSGPHFATRSSCPEHARQKAIKQVMSEENIPYNEASLRFRPVRRSFADTARNSQQSYSNSDDLFGPTPLDPLHPPHSQRSQTPRSYRKTTFTPRRAIPPRSPGYDKAAHDNITRTPQSSQPNGCAYINSDTDASVSPNDNLIKLLISTLANQASNDPNDWLDAFLDKLAPPYAPAEDCFPPSPSPPSSDRMDEPFSFSELSAILDHLDDSSPGIDGIPYSFLKNCTDLSKRFLLSIFNKIYESGSIPDPWKQQIVIPLLKPNKDPSDPSSRRPIALSSVLAKILEHLIKNRLEWILESRHILSQSQFGFRRGLGTMDSLSILTSDIRLALSRGQHLVGVFLDITSAYDNVQLPLLRQKMQQLSIPSKMIHVICNLFMERSICVRSDNHMLPPRTIWKGLPQGSVLSPILYSLYTSDLDKTVDSFCDILQYADDIVLYYYSDSFPDCTSRLNAALRYLNEWLQDHGLNLSPSKSRAVVFSRRRWIPDIDIVIDEEPVSVEDNVKFLGVHLDSRMTGVPHLKYVQNKCEKGINVMRALSGVWWGAHPYSQKLLYNAIVRSHLDYGAFLLEPCSKLSLSCLDKIQSRCLRIIAGAMKSSPINALQVECLDPPLRLRRQFLSDRYLLKTIQYSDHPIMSRLLNLSHIIPSSKYWTHKEVPCLIKTFQKYSDNPPILKFTGNPLFSINFDALIFQPNIILSFGIKKDTLCADSIFNKTLSEKWEGWTSVFTDASKLSEQGNVGSAVWIPRYKIMLSFSCHPKSSVFSGEAIALFEAVSSLESTQVPIFNSDTAILVINTNVKHQLTGSEYPQRRAQCQAAADILGKPSLRGTTVEQLEGKPSVRGATVEQLEG
ncbi:hypothetical protein MSG28_003872 [Choristoneura fumiferana]|uniref:Uncharacterized protein n=1 Tax=Choristoneura fumiferana TaxID=7141 RepID=A0ACC0KGC6_CHOFU|nr:hypothetical protein MSG28_003872 [Choristoneura fumiferana]